MRYIVFGGAGFVGGYTLRALLESIFTGKIPKGSIVCIDKVKNDSLIASLDAMHKRLAPNQANIIEYTQIDIALDFDFAFLPDDIVIHLAARAYAPKPPKHNLCEYFMQVNYKGTQKIITLMLQAGCKNLIYFSTDMVYGKPLYLPLDTSHPRNPIGFYGKSKCKSEDFIFESRKKGLNATIFRPRIIVGAGRFGILTKLFGLIEHSLPVPLIGDGNNCYQMVSVQDCAQAIICAIIKDIPNTQFNLGSLNPPTIKDLLHFLITHNHSHSFLIPTYAKGIKCILKILGLCGIHLMYEEQYQIADAQYIVDISKTQKMLEWNPTQNDKDMLLEAFIEYKAHKTHH